MLILFLNSRYIQSERICFQILAPQEADFVTLGELCSLAPRSLPEGCTDGLDGPGHALAAEDASAYGKRCVLEGLVQ